MSTEEISTLSELYQTNKKNAYILAIVLDSSAQYKTSNDYLTRVKVIDDTFNRQIRPQLKKDFFEICHFSSTQRDIIYLRKYNVSAENEERLQIETNHKAKCSYLLFDSEQNSYDPVDTDYLGEFHLSNFIRSRIDQLRKYSFTLFSSTSLRKMSWFGLQEIQGERQLSKKDFDLLLRVKKVEKQNTLGGVNEVRLTLTDSENMDFFLDFQDRNFGQGQIVKIRSVRFMLNFIKTSDKDGFIEKNDYSNVLKIPHSFYDFNNFNEIKYDFLDYNRKNQHFDDYIEDPSDQFRKFTILKRIHSFNPVITPLSNILRLQNNPAAFSSIRSQKYKLQCYLVDILPSQLTDSVKRVSYDDPNNYCLLKDFDKYQESNELSRVLELQLVVKDQSIDLSKQVVRLVLLQEEKEHDFDFLKGVELANINKENYEGYQKIYDGIIQRLLNYSILSRPFDVVVSPILFEGQILFRIIDTQFLP